MPLTNLNQEQQIAVTSDLGHNLIIASAGTGKTSTIVGRIAYLLKNKIKPQDILLLTFTNKASSQMIQRIASHFDDETAKKIVSGTFHSVSYKLLKQSNNNIVLKQPSELKVLFKSLYEKRVFIDNETNPYDGNYLYDLYSLYLNTFSNESFTKWLEEKNPTHKPFFEIYDDVILEFNELKQTYNYIDFNDLLIFMIKLAKQNNIVFKEILVDEYQDTNSLQGKLLDSFKTKSLFCVGDYDQSIYAFNGSNIDIINTFNQRYKKSNIYTLTKNYRSLKPILDLATKVINHNPRIYDKKLEVIRDSTNAKSPKLLVFDEVMLQYEHIANNIQASKIAYDNIAVLYRNNSSADGIEAYLKERNIPTKRKGGHSFFDSLEIKAILNIVFLSIGNNDMMAFIGLLEYGKGIGKVVAKELFDALVKVGHNNLFDGLFNPDFDIHPYEKTKIQNIQLGLFDNFVELGSISKFKDLKMDEKFLSNPVLKHPKLTIEGGEFLYNFWLLLHNIKRYKHPNTIIAYIVKSDFFKEIQNKLATKRSILKDGQVDKKLKQNANLRIDKKIAILHTLSQNYNLIEKFINAMILGGGELSQGEGVNLLTIHSSKGLEFDIVYIVDLAKGRFPNTKLISKGGSLEEERRLFYVAVTRAKDILYLSYAKYDKIKKLDYVPSVFLKESNFI